jgi:outer membrane protein
MFNKALLSLTLFLGVTLTLSAQTEKGNIVLGPEFGFLNQTVEVDGADEEITTTAFNLKLTGGYFVADNLAVGLQFGTASSKVEFDSDETSSSSTFIGPVAAYYISLSDDLYLPVAAGVGLNFSNDDNGNEVKSSGIAFGLSAGLEYFLSENVGLKLTLGWNSASLEEEDELFELDITEIVAGIGFNIYFGG